MNNSASHPLLLRVGARRFGWRLASCFLFFLTLQTIVFAQSGVISGHVSDTTGAAVQHASVKITNLATAVVTSTTSNNVGYYQFPPLAPANYVLHVKATNFSDGTVNDILLEVGGSRSIDIRLEIGKATQSITVEASAPELVTNQPDRGNVIESEFVDTIPLNIRNPLQMVNLAQGVTAYNSDSGNNDNSESLTNTFRINGGWPPRKACWMAASTPRNTI